MSPSGPQITPPDVPVPPPRVRTAQTPRVDTGCKSSNLRSSRKNNLFPKFALETQLLQVREANAVTHQKSGIAQDIDIWLKVQIEKNGNDTLQMTWGNYPRVSEM